MPVRIESTYSNDILTVKIVPSAVAGLALLPYHIALLLDTSGSMEGAPLAAVVRTLHLLIDAIGDGNILTIIQYSSEGRIVANATLICADARLRLHTLVDTLKAEGGTNMESAIEQLGDVSTAAPPINSVFLMTDGHINIGITNATGLIRMMTARVAAGTPVNTLGFGTSHNASMLRDMAVKNRGSYTYADAVELIPAIIGDILGGLVNQVGRNATLTAAAGGTCLELGTLRASPSVYTIGSLVADKPQWALFSGQCLPLTFTWTEGGVNCVQTVSTVSGGLDPITVEQQIQRIGMVTTMTEVSRLLDQRRFTDAIAALIDRQGLLNASPAKNTPFVLRLQAQVDEMLDDIRQRNLDDSMTTRMASNITALGNQQGFFLSRNTTLRDPDNVQSPFSTSHQREVSIAITQQFQDPL